MKTAQRLAHVLIIASVLFVSGCASIVPGTESPDVSITNLKLLDVQLLEQRYGLTVRIQNPNNFPLPITGLSYKLEINDDKLAHGVSNQAVTIPAFGEKKLELIMVSGTFGIIRQLQSLEQGAPKMMRYRLSGKLSLSNRLLPIHFEKLGELDLQKSPRR